MQMLQNIKVTDVTYSLKISADSVVTDWNSGYRNSYIANNGTSVGSSVNSTTNNFVKNLEKNIRSGKLEFLQDFSPVA
jgi:hypothetical protein